MRSSLLNSRIMLGPMSQCSWCPFFWLKYSWVYNYLVLMYKYLIHLIQIFIALWNWRQFLNAGFVGNSTVSTNSVQRHIRQKNNILAINEQIKQIYRRKTVNIVTVKNTVLKSLVVYHEYAPTLLLHHF